MLINTQTKLFNLPLHFAVIPVGFGQFSGTKIYEIPDWYLRQISRGNDQRYCYLLDLQRQSNYFWYRITEKFSHGIGRRKSAQLDLANLNSRQIEVLKLFQHRQYGGRIGRIGSGKTRTVLSIIKNFGGKSLVICSKNIFLSWENEIKKYLPELDYKICAEEKLVQLEGRHDCYILNYHSFLNEDIVKKIIEIGFDNFFLDESQMIKNADGSKKNPRGKIVDAILKTSWHIPFRYFITGTPRTNHMLDYWPQIGFLDHGRRLESNFYNFRQHYFYARNFKWLITEQNKKILSDKISETCVVDPIVEEDIKPEIKIIESWLADDEIRIYRRALTELQVLVKDEIKEIMNPLALITRLHQISGGGIGEERASQSKLKTLCEIVDSIDEPIIIICRYRHEILEIKKKYKSALLFYGGVSDRERIKSQQDFRSGASDILILQQDAAVGIDGLQHRCRVMIFYSYWYKWDVMEQNMGRILRSGQTQKCIFIKIWSKLPGLVGQDEKIDRALALKDIDIKDFINMCVR